ncbi:MAG: signal peptidase II [Alphaproteobacteria bacterium]|nr:signal peptidase II [Alphaproteobacteria bacterium]
MLRLGLLVAVVVFVLDQATKWYAMEVLDVVPGGRVLPVLPFLDLVAVRNTGISFGMLQSRSQLGPILLVAFAVVVTGFLVVWMARARSAVLAVGLGLAVGGALGNLVDRLRWGWVYDFLYAHLGAFDWWPVFNVADAAIVVGFALIVLPSLFARRGRGI